MKDSTNYESSLVLLMSSFFFERISNWTIFHHGFIGRENTIQITQLIQTAFAENTDVASNETDFPHHFLGESIVHTHSWNRIALNVDSHKLKKSIKIDMDNLIVRTWSAWMKLYVWILRCLL